MKSILFTAVAVLFMYCANAQTNSQWSYQAGSTTNIYYTNGNVGIGTSTPTEGKLQVGGLNTGDNKLVIPGVYNFERVKLGQYGNGAGALEFLNHKDAVTSYGIRLLANVDQAQGLQFQYAPYNTSELNLTNTYATSMFIRATDGNVGIGTINPGGKLQVADGGDDSKKYGAVQIVRAANPSDSFFHLSFIRNGIAVTGMGYVRNSSTLAIWTGGNSNVPTPTISFLQNQSVGIGTTNTGNFKLAVEGSVGTRKIVVTQATTWPDYVFEPTYQLPSLQSVENFININKHLPEVPSAESVSKEGIDIGNNQTVLLKKIEELTLYMIEQNKEITLLKQQSAAQNRKLEAQQSIINLLSTSQAIEGTPEHE